MTSTGATRLRVAALNCQPLEPGHHGIDSVVTAVDALGPAPHVLCLTGTIRLRLFNSSTLLTLTQRLNELLPGGDFYYPFVSERPGTRNPPGLWLSGRHIYPIADHQLPHPSDPRPSHEVYPHTVEVMLTGGHVWLKAVHWREPDSPQGPIVQSAIDSRLATKPSVLLGTFAAPLVEDAPSLDRAERRTNLDALQRVLHAGFWDAAETPADPTPQPGTPETHILVSHQASAQPVPGSHVLSPATDAGTCPGIACDLDFALLPTPATDPPRHSGSSEAA